MATELDTPSPENDDSKDIVAKASEIASRDIDDRPNDPEISAKAQVEALASDKAETDLIDARKAVAEDAHPANIQNEGVTGVIYGQLADKQKVTFLEQQADERAKLAGDYHDLANRMTAKPPVDESKRVDASIGYDMANATDAQETRAAAADQGAIKAAEMMVGQAIKGDSEAARISTYAVMGQRDLAASERAEADGITQRIADEHNADQQKAA